jgi:ubiquinone/menaquinone biosynthesis C-methylase UbiE
MASQAFRGLIHATGAESTMASVSNELKTQYDSYYGDSKLAEWRRLGAIDKVENIVELSKGLDIGSVLDVGCGDGSIIGRLSAVKFGREYTGVDISSSAIAAASSKEIPGARFDTFDGGSLPFGERQFDLVVMSHVVEHLEHPRILIREAQRVGRRVVIEVPCEHTVRLPRDYVPDPVGHINYYTPVTIRRLLQTVGLTVDKQITRGCSLDVMRFDRPWAGLLQQAVRETALKVAPPLAPMIFVYHSALLCH